MSLPPDQLAGFQPILNSPSTSIQYHCATTAFTARKIKAKMQQNYLDTQRTSRRSFYVCTHQSLYRLSKGEIQKANEKTR